MGNIDRAVRIRERQGEWAGFAWIMVWDVLPGRTVGKGSRTPLSRGHITRQAAVNWAREHGYLVLGLQ